MPILPPMILTASLARSTPFILHFHTRSGFRYLRFTVNRIRPRASSSHFLRNPLTHRQYIIHCPTQFTRSLYSQPLPAARPKQPALQFQQPTSTDSRSQKRSNPPTQSSVPLHRLDHQLSAYLISSEDLLKATTISWAGLGSPNCQSGSLLLSFGSLLFSAPLGSFRGCMSNWTDGLE